jgi:RNA polymerase sigma-70 factor (ECF subfamily)
MNVFFHYLLPLIFGRAKVVILDKKTRNHEKIFFWNNSYNHLLIIASTLCNNMNEKEIINGCKRADPLAMKTLYDSYYSLMLGICIRYVGNIFDAEDLVQEGFVKIFKDIGSFSGRGSFEGWLKRVMINNTLMHLRKTKREFSFENIDEIAVNEPTPADDEELSVEQKITAADFTKEELIEIINSLPTGYQEVVNLYIIDGYKHREIAKLLNISVGTSKSQLFRARKMIKKRLLDEAIEKSKIN